MTCFLETFFLHVERKLTGHKEAFVQNYFIYKNKMAHCDSRAAISMQSSHRRPASVVPHVSDDVFKAQCRAEDV